MCVIIYIPKGEQISKQELKDAWTTNSDGSGFATIINNHVHFEKGFMTFSEFFHAVKKFIGGYELVLHFRISTSNAINKIQTHPYKLGNKTCLKGDTISPVICMNGIIYGQQEYKGYNDTMSYIQDHKLAFKVINQDILNIIASDTACKWAVVTPQGVLISDNFTYYQGRYYSNKNHLTPTYKKTCNITYSRKIPSLKSLIPSEKLYKEVIKDKWLYYQLLDIIEIWADYPYVVENMFKDCHTMEDIDNLAYQYY